MGISSYCYFETLRFDTLLAFLAKRGAKVSWSRGELLKLCIVENRRLNNRKSGMMAHLAGIKGKMVVFQRILMAKHEVFTMDGGS